MALWAASMVAAFVLGLLEEDEQSPSRSAVMVGLLSSVVAVLFLSERPRDPWTAALVLLGYFFSVLFAYAVGCLRLEIDD